MNKRTVIHKKEKTESRITTIRQAKQAEIININIPARAEYLVIARLLTSLVCKRMGFSTEKEEDVKIAVSEAYINVVNHAYCNNHKQINQTNIRYLLYQGKLAIVVKDFGKGFDPCFVQLYVRHDEVEHPERAGLGIFLIKKLMDEVEYDSSPAAGTQVKITKYK